MEATARQIGILFGPTVGGALLVVLGPGAGLLVNCLLYLPLIAWLFITPYTGHMHRGGPGASANALTLTDALRTLSDVRRQPVILAMIALGGTSSFLVGNAYQSQMPSFAADLAGGTELGYSALLTASGLGAVVAGFALEWVTQLRRPTVSATIGLGVAWALALGMFAVTTNFVLALLTLFAVGFLQLAYTSLAQTIVQLEAPPDRRGRVIGLFSMASSGLRVGSGVTVGMLGSLVGVHASLGWSAVTAAAISALLFVLTRPRPALTPAR
jgi:MFS family permease